MVHELLTVGRENAIPCRDLARILAKTPREITAAIQKERREGAPICATARGKRKGYFLAANRAEMQDFCGQLLHRAGEIHKTRRALMRTLDRLPEDKPHKWRLQDD